MWLRWLSNKLFCLFQQEYNKSWDDFLKRIAEESNVVGFSEHTVSFKLNNIIYTVWTENKFYSYGHLYRIDGEEVEDSVMFRPSYKVARKLYKLEIEIRTKDVRSKINKIYGD
jgi:hypothetical protein